MRIDNKNFCFFCDKELEEWKIYCYVDEHPTCKRCYEDYKRLKRNKE